MGVAAALIMPSTLSIIINIFPRARAAEGDRDLGERHRRGRRASARWSAASCSATSGSASIFLINVPIIVVALVAGQFLVPKSRDPEHASFDPLGAVLSIVGIVALVYGLIEAPDNGWGSPATLIVVRGRGRSCWSGFVLWELHTDEPMLDMHYFQQPGVQHRHRRHDPRVPRRCTA